MQTINRSQTLFVGIDVHKDTHTAVGLSPYGEKLFEMTISNEAEDFILLVEKTKTEAKRIGLVPSFGLEDVLASSKNPPTADFCLLCLRFVVNW